VQIQEWLEAGVISPSTSAYAAPITMPPKKDENGNVTTYRPLRGFQGAECRHRAREVPHAPASRRSMTGWRASGTSPSWTSGRGSTRSPGQGGRAQNRVPWRGGHYEFNVMPFGLVNATSVFQGTMDQVLRGLEENAACFVDDIILASDSLEEHLRLIEEVLGRLRKAGLKCHPKKCKWFQTSVNYLGHKVGQGKVAVQAAKVSCIDAMPVPKNVGDVRSFLGMVNYYRRHIPDFSSRARALNRLTRKEVEWEWGQEEDASWRDLKSALCSAPVLCTPVAGLPYQLATRLEQLRHGCGPEPTGGRDAWGHRLRQARAATQRSRTTPSYEGEMLAVVWGVRTFRHYLLGREFELFTDHQPLSWLMSSTELKGKLARWALLLMEYDFRITYRAGSSARACGCPVQDSE